MIPSTTKEEFGILFPKSIKPTSIIIEADKSPIETKPEPAKVKAGVRINKEMAVINGYVPYVQCLNKSIENIFKDPNQTSRAGGKCVR